MILVVDDNETIVEALQEMLQKAEYEVETAKDGLEAYEHVKKPDCRCMLLDINMPKLNGVELLLLMQTENIMVPTIVIAGFDDYDEDEMKQFTNVVAYLHKPFEMTAMLKAVEEHSL